MKKLVVIILILCNNIVSGYLSLPQQGTFIPEQISIRQEETGKPKDMVEIVPHRPVAAKDKYGNRLYFSPQGKLILRVNTDGTQEFSLKSSSVKKDADGNLLFETMHQRGTNIVEIKNDKGEIIGYQELGFGGKVVKEMDYHKNVIKTYTYNKFGKKVEFVLDEDSQVRTVYNDKGLAVSDVNYEGTEVAWYHYDEDNKLKLKTDIYGNKTYFDKYGNMLYTENHAGDKVVTYHYKKDNEGRWVLDTSVDMLGNITYYKNNKPQVTKTPDGEIIKEYHYDGQTLRFTFDRSLNEVTWYDIDGRVLYTTFDEHLSQEWLYYKGKLVGLWNEKDFSLIVFIHRQEIVKILLPSKPTPEEVQKWVDKGYIKKKYIP